MSAARALLREAAARGVRVYIRDGELKAAYRGETPSDLIEKLRAAKPDLLREFVPAASVEALLDAMAAEHAARRDWHTRPPEGWPHSLTLRNMLTGETTIVRLQRKDKRP